MGARGRTTGRRRKLCEERDAGLKRRKVTAAMAARRRVKVTHPPPHTRARACLEGWSGGEEGRMMGKSTFLSLVHRSRKIATISTYFDVNSHRFFRFMNSECLANVRVRNCNCKKNLMMVKRKYRIREIKRDVSFLPSLQMIIHEELYVRLVQRFRERTCSGNLPFS